MVASVGIFSCSPVLFTWAANNSAPAGRRAVVSSWALTWGACGGIAGSFLFQDREAPAYNTSWALLIALSSSALLGCAALWFSWRRENRAREGMREDRVRAQYTDRELLELGDQSPFFRFVL